MSQNEARFSGETGAELQERDSLYEPSVGNETVSEFVGGPQYSENRRIVYRSPNNAANPHIPGLLLKQALGKQASSVHTGNLLAQTETSSEELSSQLPELTASRKALAEQLRDIAKEQLILEREND